MQGSRCSPEHVEDHQDVAVQTGMINLLGCTAKLIGCLAAGSIETQRAGKLDPRSVSSSARARPARNEGLFGLGLLINKLLICLL